MGQRTEHTFLLDRVVPLQIQGEALEGVRMDTQVRQLLIFQSVMFEDACMYIAR